VVARPEFDRVTRTDRIETRSPTMDDADVVQRIDELMAEEHRLDLSHEGEGLDEEGAARRRAVELALDQCWDLLRQRRARRDAGMNPDDAEARSAEVVEHYQQ
jgi:hypothetical protein